MAAAAKKRTGRYQTAGATYGNVAYDLEYAGAVARPLEGGAQVLRPQPRVRPRERALTRPKVQVRQAGRVSLFAVVGFAAVGVFAALLLMSYVQLTVATDGVVALKGELQSLETVHHKLLAQYEAAYDLGSIEARVTADGSMVKPGPGQVYTLDLSEADNVMHYGPAAQEDPTGGLVEDAKGVLNGILEYFR